MAGTTSMNPCKNSCTQFPNIPKLETFHIPILSWDKPLPNVDDWNPGGNCRKELQPLRKKPIAGGWPSNIDVRVGL